MNLVVDIISWALILSGCFFTIVGALGIWRFPDFWARLHAASVADSGGMIQSASKMMPVIASRTLIIPQFGVVVRVV